ncbi:hypothetical protein MANES_15G192972v8 [Manihot esculenta]|uniref:Uncharacterized protein n=1 Tax=Manihot esculenta TaxID=3983 RepID=A0ACB7GCV0_MANES|nr:hypothetical protein MANES_15G192972v8 [Manihot esculenta]
MFLNKINIKFIEHIYYLIDLYWRSPLFNRYYYKRNRFDSLYQREFCFQICAGIFSRSHFFPQKVSLGKKANLIFLFFLLWKLILPFYSFTLFCITLPLSCFSTA